MSNLIWDLTLYLSSAFIMYSLILSLDDKETFLLHDGWGAFALIIILFGVSGIPFSYAFSFLFNNAASGFAFLIIVNILAGCIAPTAVFLLRDFGTQFDSSTLIDVANILQWIFYWLPIFPYTRALMAIITVSQVLTQTFIVTSNTMLLYRHRREIIFALLGLNVKHLNLFAKEPWTSHSSSRQTQNTSNAARSLMVIRKNQAKVYQILRFS